MAEHASSYADEHDRDKLARWDRDLSAGDRGRFPAHAVFLVGPEDQLAHDTFRQYRTTFEERNAGFEHLVIFGQHGVSRTLHELAAALNVDAGQLPLLLVFPEDDASGFYMYQLPPGPAVIDTASRLDSWSGVLGSIGEAASSGGTVTNSLTGERQRLDQGELGELVGRLLETPS